MHTRDSKKKFKQRLVNGAALKNKNLCSTHQIHENYVNLNSTLIIISSAPIAPVCVAISDLDDTELIMGDNKLKSCRDVFVMKVQRPTISGIKIL